MMSLIQEWVDLSSLNTFHLPVKARYFLEINHPEDFWPVKSTDKYLILGGGSNILLTRDFPGTVLKVNSRGIDICEETENTVTLAIAAGENWHEVVKFCIDHNFGGIENLSLIPGTIGAAPLQNIGAYGVEFEQVFKQLMAINLYTGEKVYFSKQDCQFSYRHSIFKQPEYKHFLISKIWITLTKHSHTFNIEYGAIRSQLQKMKIKDLSLRAISDAVIQIRQEKLPDPAQLGNAGSFFKNPIITRNHYQSLLHQYPQLPHYPVADHTQVKIPAAWLIEQNGLKGWREGNCGIHKEHALVLVNYGGANGQEIWNLAQMVIASIKKQFQVELTPEVNVY
ncbi:MAG: UDP-N-acetylmuramate dehydrogenase [Legionellales bacterium]|nr:UDP-N-acetylmuramate dehydrogenase [Legionellales bacterium]